MLLEEAEISRGLDGRFAISDAKLAVDRFAMSFDGVQRYIQLGGDVALGEL